MRLLLSVCFACAALAVAGCNADADTWKPHYGDVTAVREGMDTAEVTNLIGKPDYVIAGEGLRINYEEWVYKTGSVFFNRLRVMKAISRSKTTPPPPKPKDDWNLKPLE